LPTLRRELLTAFALVFAGALLMGAAGVVMLLPVFETPAQTAFYLTILLGADVAVFAVFGRFYIQRRVVEPLEAIIAEVEAIAAGDYTRRLPAGETREVTRLAEAVNRMTESLMANQRELAANIRSLDETNRQLVEARDELIRAEKMVSVGRLGAGIAHEIGNPLGAIMGYLGVLRRGADEQRLAFLASAEKEAQRIDRIIRGLLDFSRPRERRSQSVDVNEVVDQTVELLTTQGQLADVSVEVTLAEELPYVSGDLYQLQQVLVNLVMNALDALRDRPYGVITIRTGSRTYHPRQRFPARRQDDPPEIDYSHRRRLFLAGRVVREDPVPDGEQVVEIVVADNGPGIPPRVIDQVFEPFVTTKEPGKGTGLGLAVAARIIDAMGGTVRAESPPGQGAVFTILLPAAGAAVSLQGA
jgi:two-component system, NtrC family, sensor kinase